MTGKQIKLDVTIRDDAGTQNVRCVAIGPIIYVVGRRKGRKYPALWRWDPQTRKAIAVASFKDDVEAEMFWNFFLGLAEDYNRIVGIVGENVLAWIDWRENSVIEEVRRAGSAR